MSDFERIDCPKHGVKFAYREECEFPKEPKSQAILAIERKVIESRTKMVRDISLKWSAAESRVAVLEGLLREYRNSDCEHLGCYLGQYVNGRKHDYRCDVCMRADSILAPAPLTEGE